MANFEPAPTYAEVIQVDPQTGRPTFNPIWLNWFLKVAAFLTQAGGTAANHEALTNLLGGDAGGHYHFTASELSSFQAGNGVTGTVTLAALTGLGATGSLTFADGIIIAFTPPT
jgi:hypothetical protein